MTRQHATYTSCINSLPLDAQEARALRPVMEYYAFRANDYYLSLINWDDPADPIRRIIVPHPDETKDWGELDPSDEARYTAVPGMQHKYRDTAILLAGKACGGLCRFCFRKRIFMEGGTPPVPDTGKALAYIRAHKKITNVLISGGDPLLLPLAELEHILKGLDTVDHLQFIRIGSRMPVFDPGLIAGNTRLLELLSRYSRPGRKLYMQTHFNHPRELSPLALEAVDALQRAGIIMTNQTPLLRGVNDCPETLSELFAKLAGAGVPPYYLFVCRPTKGNRHFTVPIEEGYDILQKAQKTLSGPAKRVRYAMSHATGKIEVVSVTHDQVVFRRHRTPNPAHSGSLLSFPRNPAATWLDDYTAPAGKGMPRRMEGIPGWGSRSSRDA
ncbi:KamA family radical SAM protein [Oleidesulfovibrio alaskensis]|jgi:KamA family protein|uniref:KamA family radical SAM protein n=1 Tax=Oleidesulfovibrio alaskensis TaxID=58180 RepID=UPI001A3DC255|nr:KamA family radical SAM protein [Oleidesulfovibrio alaskensis]MBL3582244.1 KamA family radical SAM protein [Oleidesulfovibrio alaskensis]